MFIKYLLKYIIVNKNCHFICRRNIDQIKLTLRDFPNFLQFYIFLPNLAQITNKIYENVLGIVSSNFPT